MPSHRPQDVAECAGAKRILHRWRAGPRIHVNGSPTAGDLEVLASVMEEINELAGTVRLQTVEDAATAEIHFAPASTFPRILPQYVPGNIGFFWAWWSPDQSINYRSELSSGMDPHTAVGIVRTLVRVRGAVPRGSPETGGGAWVHSAPGIPGSGGGGAGHR